MLESAHIKMGWLGVALTLVLAGGCASFEAARLYQSGSEALEHGEVDRAITELERAAELAPDASEVHNHLGLALAADGREEAALLEFQRAVALDCANDAAQANLTVTRMRLGFHTEEQRSDADSRGETR